MTWPLSVELEELGLELAQRRRELERSERAEGEGRVTDREGWLAALGRRRQHIAELEGEEQRLTAWLEAQQQERLEELGERRRDEEEDEPWGGTGGS